MAEETTAEEAAPTEQPRPAAVGRFERDTAVWRQDGAGAGSDRSDSANRSDGARRGDEADAPAGGTTVQFGAEVWPDWRAGRGPHGGYLAAMLTRALIDAVDDAARAPRSLTVHYARAPRTGAVRIAVAKEREGRSLSTLSARMEQDGKLIALALAAFSVPWPGPELAELPMPDVAPPDAAAESVSFVGEGAPPFAQHLMVQPRLNGAPFAADERQAMEVTGWIGLQEARAVDAPMLAFLSDALIPAPFMRTSEPLPAPTIDLTVHFRTAMPRAADPDPHELCLVRTRTRVIHDGFFEEDGVIWAADGSVLAQSRQLAILMPLR